ncbi:nitroreductase family deazaflavin-dependent oxidoreductase [Mycobacteroides salmoniphilum]|uniref:nitroreductase family deazaflavin-dependent oxidoreductase n=1 Tax=Mycobacteroides salmoniphilum TaxID=404941 RepID=UPI0009947649|nr:nitroreductase family deazaflavin-dependent oxidoreductase [Mycobacteroides salmoniphilum]
MSSHFTSEYIATNPQWVDEQIEIYESSGGAEGTTFDGVPVVVLYTVGAKSGQIRKAPLMRVEHEGVYLAVGSIGGAPKNPAWVANLRTNPVIELRDGENVQTVRADEVTDEADRDTWWDRAVAAFPPYAEYTTRTARVFPLFTLTPVS